MNSFQNILIVDDDETSNLITSIKLKRSIENAIIHVSANGKDAIDLLSNGDRDFPIVILLDINMPLIDGFEFLTWFHINCTDQNSFIAMFSTSSRREDKDKAMAYKHVIDYIEKPLDNAKINTLIKKVNPLLRIQNDAEFILIG